MPVLRCAVQMRVAYDAVIFGTVDAINRPLGLSDCCTHHVHLYRVSVSVTSVAFLRAKFKHAWGILEKIVLYLYIILLFSDWSEFQHPVSSPCCSGGALPPIESLAHHLCTSLFYFSLHALLDLHVVGAPKI